MNFYPFLLGAFRVAAFGMPGPAFWPHFAGSAVLLIGLAILLKSKPAALSNHRIVRFAPVLFAMPMAVFGADHFISPGIVAGMIPSWIPWHLFWTYFVGLALIAAALSMVLNKYSTLAATLLGLMLLSFVLLLHVPNAAANVGDRIAWAVLLRDLSFSAGALAFASSRARLSAEQRSEWNVVLRLAIGVPTVYFGVQHFLHPQFVPVVPLRQLMPAWVPAPVVVSYATGIVMIAFALGILVNWKARRA